MRGGQSMAGDGRITGVLRAKVDHNRAKVRWHVDQWKARIRDARRPPVRAPEGFNTPAALDRWLERGGPSSRWAGFPTAWSARSDVRFAEPSRVAVVMHVHYPELAEEIIDRLNHIPVAFDLLVTNSSGCQFALPDRLPRNVRNHAVLDVENHGRDILPLVALVNADLLAPYQVVLKVHTKRSQWREDHSLHGNGDSWRAELLDALLGGDEQVRGILASMVEDRNLGVITAPGSVLDEAAWGDNEPIAVELLRRLELDLRPADLRFPAGSMYWIRGFVLQGLRGLNLTRDDFESEVGQDNLTTAHALERLIGVLTLEAGLRVTDTRGIGAATDEEAWRTLECDSPAEPRARVVPFFLPQFHSIDENDAWWGPGFTEWTNVTAAKPLYRGHWQPKLPRDLGFYDLSDERVVLRQEGLARRAGVAGFMFYHYWFSGQPILEAPLDGRRGRVDGLPFCLMWANENWTRRWDGRSEDVLMGQDHDVVPPAEFLGSILDLLSHPDYLTVDGRPVLSVYRPAQLPVVEAVVEQWRAHARGVGLDLFLLAVDVPGSFDGLSGRPQDHGFDGVMGFAPHNFPWAWVDRQDVGMSPRFAGNQFSYGDLVEVAGRRLNSGVAEDEFPGVMVGFDNTARRALTPDMWFGSNPYTFRRWLAMAVQAVADRPMERRLVFLNAWNEWAEGAMLEPSDKFGLSYLQAIRDVLL